MSDLRRLKALLSRVEPLAAVLRDAGLHEFGAATLASALIHSRYAEKVEGVRDLVGEIPPLVRSLVLFRATGSFGVGPPDRRQLEAADALLLVLGPVQERQWGNL